MRGGRWGASLEEGLRVCVECIRGMVLFYAEKNRQKVVGGAVQKQLKARKENHAPATYEPAAENAVMALIEQVPVHHDVAAVVRLISHHDHRGVSPGVVQAKNDSAAETGGLLILKGAQCGNPFLSFLNGMPGALGATVIHDNNFVRDLVEAKFYKEMFHC